MRSGAVRHRREYSQPAEGFSPSHRKYPDFIDAGIDAWEAVYDWHVKNRQEVKATRLADGR